MADFNALEALINAYIKQNGVKAITGNILNGVLRGMVSALGKGWTIADGDATPTTDPGTMTGPVAYIAHTAGTYEHFGNLVVNDGEVALLKYNEQTWTKEVIASLAATASVDGNVGTPAVDVTFQNGVLSFDFRNMKGNTGDSAGFGTIHATVDANIGTPGVSVQTSGPDTAKNMTFAFTNLKGETGVTSVVVTVDNTVGTPSCAVSLVGQELHLDFHGLKGAQGDTGVSADYPITIVNNLTTNDPASALSAAMGVQLEGEISQLEAKVDGVTTKNYTEGYKVLQSGELEEDATSVVCDKVPVSFGDVLSLNDAYSYLCAYDANDVKLDHWSARNSVSLTATAVQNVAYVLCSFLKTNLSTAYIKKGTTTLWEAEESHTPGLVEKVAELENGLSSVEDSARQAITLANTADEKIEGTQNYIDGYKVNQDGTLGEDETSIVSDKITASVGDVFTFNNAYSFICAYDANDTFLDYWSARASVTIGSSLTTVAYIRVSVLKTNISTAYVKRNNTTVWIPMRTDGVKDDIREIDAVLGKIDKDVFNYSIVGVGQDYSKSKASLDIKPNHSYRLVPITKTWTVDPATIGAACFWLNLGGEEKFVVNRDLQTGVVTLDDYYDFSVTDQFYATVYIRASVGDTIYFKLLDLSETLPEGNLERIVSDEERIKALEEGGDILRLHPYNTTAPKLANLNEILSVDLNHPFGTVKNFVALFFSDLHSTSRELGRIMKFYNAYSSYFTEIMQGGDLLHSFNDSTQFITDNGAESVVGVMGNHEQFNSTPQLVNGVAITSWNKNSQKMNYDKLIAPYLAETGITVVANHTYWYKDFADQKIRLIGIDDYHWREHVVMEGGAIGYEYADGEVCDNGEQAAWFETTLAGAKTAGYSVIVLGHGPSRFDLIDSPFTTLDYINDIGGNPSEAVDIVQDFIDGGGKFVCWMNGHIHQDAIGHVKDHPEQFQINIDTCRYGSIFGTLVAWGENKKILNTMSEDVFDVISVDSNRQYLTVMRFGCESDRWGRHIGTFVYDYGTHRVVYNPQ